MLRLIQKSGTGIQKSGTGIGQDKTGVSQMLKLGSFALFLLMLHGLAFAQSDAGITLSQTDSGLVVSLHDSTGVYVGQAGSVADGYYMVPLYRLVSNGHFERSFAAMIAGSGRATAGEAGCGGNDLDYHGSGSGKDSRGEGACERIAKHYHGSGSGSSGESAGCGSASLQYHGSGSGSSSSGQSECRPAAGEPLYHGSGSGSAGDAAACARAALKYHGSGSGGAGEQVGACRGLSPWGVVEVAIDASGASVVVNRLSATGLEEHVVAFLPGLQEALTGFSASDRTVSADSGAIAIP